MLIFKRGHTHINQDDLSEYLDGRLSGTAATRIDRRLTECATCRQDLDALRSTVSLLQQMPELTLPRSFIMPGPPPAPVALRPPAPLRMPQWVYSGAAATAALVFAILVSADATGLLAPKLTAQPEVTAQALRAAPESFQQDDGDGAAGAIEMAAPQAPAEMEAAVAEKGFSVTTIEEKESVAAEAQALTQPQAAAPSQSASDVKEQDASASAPVAAMAAPEVEKAVESKSAPPPPVATMATTEVEEVANSEAVRPRPEAAMSAPAAEEAVKAESVPPTPEAAMAAAKADESAEVKADSTPSIIALTTTERPPEPTTTVQDSPRGIPPPYNPVNIWRVLEGLAAVAAVGFLVIWILRRRAGH